uniref:Archaeal Lon protease n=1 Tax=Candidatus Methanophagaceae archaeon ANME-1 ERB6 TaxID=2759912 RepID=A0A7G9YYG5_9EURY|nr:archaeal Lon protease [Methanosarcinales archaeon ANME-1 ERB6]
MRTMTESNSNVASSKGEDKRRETDLLGSAEIKTTEEIEVPKLLVDQVIGQERGVEVIKKAAKQRRHVMLIGTPGTGKSMLGSSMAELLPKEELQDILVYPNPEDKNTPKIRVVPYGKGKEIVDAQKLEVRKRVQMRNTFVMFTFFLVLIMGVFYAFTFDPVKIEYIFWSIIAGAVMLLVFRWMMPKEEALMPKLLVSNFERETAPYVDATGAHSGALLGDVRHDPYQSGGLETPAHDRVEAGAIHKANKGVLFIDEINTLRVEAQQNLLTALQEKEYPITGQSERSAGAMVKTDPVPCDFTMIAAGNLDAVAGMHPALRSRIKGYGYEIYMKDTMDDTEDNKKKLVRFIAQEVKRDKKIPHFDRSGVEEILREARRRSGRKGHFTLILRDLGGLVRVAGDIARAEGAKYVTGEHVIKGKAMAKSVEQQMADEYLEHKKDYKLFKTEGYEIGKVNGLAVVGDSGVMLPIIAEVTPAQSREEGKVIATGRLQEIAQEAVQNVSAVFKKFTGKNISTKDIHIQFVGTHEGVEGDSASISIATAVISSLENIPVNQGVAMTGSLSVRGDVLPVGGITPKVEAAVQAGIKEVLIPQANMNDVLIEDRYKDKVKITSVVSIEDVLEHVLAGKLKKKFIERIKSFTTGVEKIIPERVVDKSAIQQ